MRAKYLWKLVPSQSYVRLLYARVTHTKFTTSYFFLALAFCLIQIVFLSISYSEHRVSLNFLASVISRSGVKEQFATVADGELWVCDALRTLESTAPSQCRSLTDQGIENDVPLSINMGNGQVSELSLRCVEALAWPKRLLRDASREDLALLAFQVWLFVLSAVAIVNESIPHLVAAFISHATHTGWVALQFPRWHKFYDRLETFVTDDACGGIDLLPGFWGKRVTVLAPTLALSAIALVLVAAISLKLFTIYVRQVFKHVDASPAMNKLYKTVMIFTVFMQLSSFFVLISTALWVDELLTGMMSEHAQHLEVYLAVFSVATLLDLIWIVLGYNSIRKECKYRSAAFVLIGVTITAIWSFMFTSRLYRWAFATWPFFAAMTVMSFIYLVITIVLAILCRANFGKGLAPYLRAQVSYDDVDFDPVSPKNVEAGFGRREDDDEKMDFLDVPITVTVPYDGPEKSSSAGVENSSTRSARRLSRAIKSRSSWTTLLDNYSFTFASTQSQVQTQIEEQLPSSYQARPSMLSSVAEDGPNPNAAKRRPPSSYQIPPEKNAYNGFARTWEELMDYKSDADNRTSSIMPSRPIRAVSGRKRRDTADRVSYVSNETRPASLQSSSSNVGQGRLSQTKTTQRSVKVTRFASAKTKGTAGLPESPRAALTWF